MKRGNLVDQKHHDSNDSIADFIDDALTRIEELHLKNSDPKPKNYETKTIKDASIEKNHPIVINHPVQINPENQTISTPLPPQTPPKLQPNPTKSIETNADHHEENPAKKSTEILLKVHPTKKETIENLNPSAPEISSLNDEMLTTDAAPENSSLEDEPLSSTNAPQSSPPNSTQAALNRHRGPRRDEGQGLTLEELCRMKDERLYQVRKELTEYKLQLDKTHFKMEVAMAACQEKDDLIQRLQSKLEHYKDIPKEDELNMKINKYIASQKKNPQNPHQNSELLEDLIHLRRSLLETEEKFEKKIKN
eukprot:Sdes_comp23614_c0_seq1m21810